MRGRTLLESKRSQAWAVRASAGIVVVASLLAVSLSGCGAGYLDVGKKVPATAENKAVFDVIVAYHHALEDRDTGAVRKLISKRYYENGGTTDSDKDDYGVDRLQADVIPRLRDNVKRLQMQIRLRDIRINGEKAECDFEFFGRVLITEGGRKSYKMWNEFAQMRFVREDEKWMIAGGL
jgi:hypothetical protein